jgi:hypothetical protein
VKSLEIAFQLEAFRKILRAKEALQDDKMIESIHGENVTYPNEVMLLMRNIFRQLRKRHG